MRRDRREPPRHGVRERDNQAPGRRLCSRHYGISRSLPTRVLKDRPPDVAAALRWLEKASLPVSDVGKPIYARAVLDAISVRQDGAASGATTIARKRSVFANVLGYAIELEELS
jgi:hypothetical protein